MMARLMKLEKEKEEMEQCTFNPKINKPKRASSKNFSRVDTS